MTNYAKRNIAPSKGARQDTKYSIIIPSAGQGIRMMSHGAKSLIKIGGETIINRQLRLIKQVFKFYEIILITGFQANKVMNRTPDDIIKIENELYNDTNVVRSIGMGLRATTTNNVIIIYGDLFFNQQAINISFNKKSVAILSEHMSKEDVGCVLENHYIQNFFYDINNKWGQIIYLTGEELKLMKKIAWDRDRSNIFGFEALNLILDSGGRIEAYKPPDSYTIDIDSSKDLIKAEQLL